MEFWRISKRLVEFPTKFYHSYFLTFLCQNSFSYKFDAGDVLSNVLFSFFGHFSLDVLLKEVPNGEKRVYLKIASLT